MDIMELGAIGELVGGAAVVVTLGYLAVQVRQNTASNRYLATQGMVTNQVEANYLLATHPDLTSIARTSMDADAFARLPGNQQMQFNAFMVGFFLQNDFAYHQYLNHQLEPKMWRRMEDDIPTFLTIPGQAKWWNQDKQRFTPEFVAFVDRKLAAYEPPDVLPTMGPVDNSRSQGG